MSVRPSETSQGAQWLGNFPLDERRAATLLIDTLRVVSSSGFRAAMSDALSTAIDEREGPVGFYPVREIPEDDEGRFLPLDHPYEAIAGSEALVGNIIRDAVGRWPNLDIAGSYRSFEELKQYKVRTLLLVDDYSGTGSQVVKYVDAWMRHPTIKSWHSYGLVRVHVLLLAASVRARERLEDHRFVSTVRYLERGLGFDTAPWTEEERKAIEALCQKYAYKPKYAFGYGRTRGLLALHHTVPNNLPQILWQTKCSKVRDWVPLFGNREMPTQFQAELDDYRLETDPQRIAAIIRQEGLGKALDGQTNATVRNFLLVLGAVESGRRGVAELSDLIGFSLETTRRTLEACQELNLLDSAFRLTHEGRNELRRALRRPIVPRRGLPNAGSKAPYYPLSLRGAT